MPPKKRTKIKRKKKKVEPDGIANIKASFNNTTISLADNFGNIISWATAGTAGFKGSRKNTPFAAQKAAEDAAKRAYDMGLRNVEVRVKGPGGGREASIRAIHTAGLTISVIRDITPVPHNGCRPPKKRRV